MSMSLGEFIRETVDALKDKYGLTEFAAIAATQDYADLLVERFNEKGCYAPSDPRNSGAPPAEAAWRIMFREVSRIQRENGYGR